jgi:predicted nucleic acid-binding protein
VTAATDYLAVDTDVASLFWKGRLPAHLNRFFYSHILLVTPVTIGEALKGAYEGGWSRGRLSELLVYYERMFGLLSWHAAIPMAYGRLAGLGRRRGITIGENDVWIAAWCLAHQIPLLTMNLRHFEPLRPFGLDLVP